MNSAADHILGRHRGCYLRSPNRRGIQWRRSTFLPGPGSRSYSVGVRSSKFARPRRHNYTRQRELLLGLLYGTDAHPTAAELFEALRPEIPQLSLGTLYRNLDVLVSEGLIEQIPTVGAERRYQAKLRPHHHFICEDCGIIRDAELPVPKQLKSRLRRAYHLNADKIRIEFYGLCQRCSDRES